MGEVNTATVIDFAVRTALDPSPVGGETTFRPVHDALAAELTKGWRRRNDVRALNPLRRGVS